MARVELAQERRVLCWPDGKPLGEHRLRTGVMAVGKDHWKVTYCGRCGAVDSQERQ